MATLETYVRADDTDAHRFADTLTTTRVGVDPTGAPRLEDLDDLAPDGSGTAQLMLHRVETFRVRLFWSDGRSLIQSCG